jgi:hypothetical protein
VVQFRSSGANDVQPHAKLSRKHSSGVQDTLARASLSFGTGHSKVEVRAVHARAWHVHGCCQLRRPPSLGFIPSLLSGD